VGEFNATDANDGNITYELVSGENNNSFFTLETNGTLKTATTFDYESNASSYTITVQAKDEHNASTEGNFTISILDQNEAPYHLSTTAPLRVQENLPIGTFVGTFSAKDPDGDELIYKLGGDGNNTLPFALSEKGELRTTKILDFEIQETQELEVLALDKEGSFTSSIFMVQVVDCFVPMVETFPIKFDENGSVRVGGELRDDGGNSQNLEVGIEVSAHPFRGSGSVEINLKLQLQPNSFTFNDLINIPAGWKKIYARAYAKNVEGTSYGLEESISNHPGKPLDLWANANQLDKAPGWWESPWFGTFYKSESGWLLHLDLGWIYPSPGGSSSLWLWRDQLGWVWTRQGVYPYLYRAERNGWIYFYGEYGKNRLLFDYESEDWLKIDDSKVIEKENAR